MSASAAVARLRWQMRPGDLRRRQEHGWEVRLRLGGRLPGLVGDEGERELEGVEAGLLPTDDGGVVAGPGGSPPRLSVERWRKSRSTQSLVSKAAAAAAATAGLGGEEGPPAADASAAAADARVGLSQR